jgi:hypothetical protein
MFDLQRCQGDDAVGIGARHMSAAQAKWDRLTTMDLSGVRTRSELVERVEARYSLPHEQAESDVEFWASDKQF